MRITFENQIAAPVPVVWSFLDDDAKLPLWMPEVVDVSYQDGKNRDDPVGTVFRQTLKEGGREKTYDGLVTAYESERLLGVRLTDGQFGVDVRYVLSPTAQGTRLDYTAELALQSLLARILGFLFKPLTMSILRRHMANLKRVAEQAVD
ncbi:MAG: SRPBCC family protein [Methyloceanibacter sp.]|nr:SRPBCC family protein [Methyloceanibacter sp.]